MINIKNKIITLLSGNMKYLLIFLTIMSIGILNIIGESKNIRSYEVAASEELLMDAGMNNVFSSRTIPASMPMQKAMVAESSMIMSDAVPSQSSNNRKIQETFNVSVLGPNKDVGDVYRQISELCLIDVCEIEQSDLYTGGSQFSANLRLKLDHRFVNQFFNQTDSVYSNYGFNITNKSRSSQDRTAQFSDIVARRDAQIVLRTRLNKLVENYQGRDIKSLLEIERELARVQGQIESMDAQLRSISFVTDRATVNVSIEGKVEYKPSPTQSAIMKAINDAWGIVEHNIAKIIRMISAILPWFFLSILAIGIWKIVRRFMK